MSTGSKVEGFKPDEVIAASGSMGSNGTYAEYLVVLQEVLALKPEGINFEEAASIPDSFLILPLTEGRV